MAEQKEALIRRVLDENVPQQEAADALGVERGAAGRIIGAERDRRAIAAILATGSRGGFAEFTERMESIVDAELVGELVQAVDQGAAGSPGSGGSTWSSPWRRSSDTATRRTPPSMMTGNFRGLPELARRECPARALLPDNEARVQNAHSDCAP